MGRLTTGFSPIVRLVIKERAGMQGGYIRCEYCGDWNQYVQIHHRRPRGRGGSRREDTNQPSNGVALCMGCHEGFELDRHFGYQTGWLLRRHQTPTEVPLEYPDGRRYLLGDDGQMYEIPRKETA